MTTLTTAILLSLTVLGAVSCDSNPVPHPGQNDGGKKQDVYTPGSVSGEADASTPPGRNENDNDDDPSTDYGNGAAEPCTPDVGFTPTPGDGSDAADAAGDADAGDGEADDNATDASDEAEPDCGPSETQAPPSGAAEQDQVEE